MPRAQAILRASNIKLTPPHLCRRANLWKLNQQLLTRKIQVLDRTKALHGPRTQASGETNYLQEKYKFWTEPRPCMVLGLKPLGKPTTYKEKLHHMDLRIYLRKTLH